MTVKCSNCGGENPDGKRFCGNCGTALADIRSSPLPSSTEANRVPDRNIYFFGRRLHPLLVLALVPILCVCACLLVFLTVPSKPTALATVTAQVIRVVNEPVPNTGTPPGTAARGPTNTSVVLPTVAPTSTNIAQSIATPTKANATSTRPPTATSKPANTPTRSAPQVFSFSDGLKIVGTDIRPGTYRKKSVGSCYWERLSGFGGELDDIIANENVDGPAIVTIAPSDKGFRSSRCGTWTQDLSAITSSPTAPFGQGVFFVNKDIAPGTWRSSGGSACYWERLKTFGGDLEDIIANDNSSGQTIVTIKPSDAGFMSHGCGTWTKIN